MYVFFGVCKSKHYSKNFKKTGDILKRGHESYRRVENARPMIIETSLFGFQGLIVTVCQLCLYQTLLSVNDQQQSLEGHTDC